MQRTVPGLIAALSALAPLLASSSAEAYCRSRTCRPDVEPCEIVGSCVIDGFELFRRSSCVSYTVQKDGSPGLGFDAELVERLVGEAFERWTSVDCGRGDNPSIHVESFGAVSCDVVEYNSDQGNANIIIFRDDWPITIDTNAFALTTVSFSTRTGEIYDVDMEINASSGELTITEPEDGIDLPSILTHETGHFLGLGHSDVAGASMRARYTPRLESLREPSEDDIEGICDVYPPDRETTSKSCTPRHGFASTCATPGGGLAASGGCALAPLAPRRGAALLFGAVALAAAAGAARRRRRAHPAR